MASPLQALVKLPLLLMSNDGELVVKETGIATTIVWLVIPGGSKPVLDKCVDAQTVWVSSCIHIFSA